MIKKPEKETRNKQFLQNLAYSINIALLQFYKQMYNKYIINRLLLWDSEEPACVGFFCFCSYSSKDGAGAQTAPYEEYSYSSALRRPKSIQPK